MEINDTACSGTAFRFNGHDLGQTGIYNDTVQTLEGCDSVIILSLFVDSPSTPTITRSGNILSSDTFAAYTWLLNDSVISGANQPGLTITQNGNYSVVVTNASGCTDTSLAYSVIDLGIGNVVTTGEVKLYPNPNNGIFMLDFTDKIVRDVEITDALGRIILSTKASKQQHFSLSELPTGIYFIQFNPNHGSGSLRFCVER